MPRKRRYIIWAFMIFAVVFTGIYFAMDFISTKSSSGYCGTVDNNKFINPDTSKNYKDGKMLFQSKCASCHILFKDFVGPDFIGLTKRGPWGDKKNILEYLKDPQKFIAKNDYMKALKKTYLVNSQGFLLSEKEIDDFVYYIESEEKNRKRNQ
jgi:cytochrome c2